MERNPIFIFNNDTDYNTILKFVELTYSDIIISSNCSTCNIKKLSEVLNYLYAANYQISKEEPDLEKYNEAVKAAYLSLLCVNCLDKNIKFTNSFIYYGISNDKSIPELSKVLKSSYISIDKEVLFYNIPFSQETTPIYYWVMEPLSEPLKNKWEDTLLSFNNGNIGTSLDLFGKPKSLNGYRFYITEYPTQFNNPIQFEKV